MYEFGRFRLDTAERILLRSGELVPLTPKAFETLVLLVRNGGHVVTKDELMREVWPDTFVEEGGLARNISVLRKALDENPSERSFIETVPKLGYRFAASVRELTDAPGPPPGTDALAPATAAAQPPAVETAPLIVERHTRTSVVVEDEVAEGAGGDGASGRERPRALPADGGKARRVWPAAVALCVLLVALGGAAYYFSGRRGVAHESGFRSIAVLPFKPLGGVVGDDDYLRLGLADALITKLSNVKQVTVRPTSAVRNYLSPAQDPLAAGRELGVESVLEGHVQRAGERVRVTVQLLSVGDGKPVWAGAFDERFTDIFTVQDAIAEKVTAALKAQVTAAERERLMRRYTQNPAAYELYLQGRAHLVGYARREDELAAVRAFEGAVRLDPDNALAHAGLAIACAIIRFRFSSEAELESWEERAKREAQRALELDPELAQAHEALGMIYRATDFDWKHAIEESDRALELNPNLDLPHYHRAASFYHLGLFDLADKEARAGLEVNPVSRFEPLRMRGMAAFYDGRFSEAVAFFEEAQRVSRDSHTVDWHLAEAYYYAGERERAEAIFRELAESASAEEHARARASLASILAARKERGRAEALLREVVEGKYMDHHAAYSVAAAYAQLGESAMARKWLARASETGLPCYPWYARDPLLDPLRGDPEFRRFMAGLRRNWEEARALYGSGVQVDEP